MTEKEKFAYKMANEAANELLGWNRPEPDRGTATWFVTDPRPGHPYYALNYK